MVHLILAAASSGPAVQSLQTAPHCLVSPPHFQMFDPASMLWLEHHTGRVGSSENCAQQFLHDLQCGIRKDRGSQSRHHSTSKAHVPCYKKSLMRLATTCLHSGQTATLFAQAEHSTWPQPNAVSLLLSMHTQHWVASASGEEASRCPAFITAAGAATWNQPARALRSNNGAHHVLAPHCIPPTTSSWLRRVNCPFSLVARNALMQRRC